LAVVWTSSVFRTSPTVDISSFRKKARQGGSSPAVIIVVRVGNFDLRSITDVLALAVGALLISLQSARHFGQFHGGNSPERS
jgi:hypothetical protein